MIGRGAGLGIAVGLVASGATPNSLPGAANLESWHLADRGVSLASALEGHGPTPPAMAIAGNLAQSIGLYIDIPVGGARGTATYRASYDGGSTFFQTGTTAASVLLTQIGITVSMANATFDVTNTYNGKASQWTNLTPKTRTLVGNATDAVKPAILWKAQNGRAAIYANGSYGEMKDTSSDWASQVASGDDSDFTIFVVSKIFGTSGSFNQILSFGKAGDANPCWGLGTSGATNWAAFKQDDTGVSQFALHSGVDTSNWHVHEIVQHGTTIDWVIDGTALFTGSAQNVGVTTLDSVFFLSGGLLGGTANAAIGEALTYNAALSSTDRDAIRAYLRGGWAI